MLNSWLNFAQLVGGEEKSSQSFFSSVHHPWWQFAEEIWSITVSLILNIFQTAWSLGILAITIEYISSRNKFLESYNSSDVLLL